MSKVYQIVTDKIVRMIEEAIEGDKMLPWSKPWRGGEMPRNFVSNKEYRGINVWLLACEQMSKGYESNYWLTFKQAREQGGSVRKGEKSTEVIFWKINGEERDANDEVIREKFLILRYYNVFNIAQCDIPQKRLDKRVVSGGEKLEFNPIEECDKLIDSYFGKPTIKHIEQRAYYSPRLDYINMPRKESFNSVEEYYSTIFHELVHSTGHEKRLNRKTLVDMVPFGSVSYSQEELVAEMGATFCCAIAGIENKTIDNSTAYLHGWLSKIKSDPKLIVQAGAAAQKAVDLIRGVKFAKKEEEVTV